MRGLDEHLKSVYVYNCLIFLISSGTLSDYVDSFRRCGALDKLL